MRSSLRYLVLLVVTSLVFTGTVPTAVAARTTVDESGAVPAPGPGMNTTTFPRLWSGDADRYVEVPGRSTEEILLNLSDYSFATPPPEMDRWNAFSLTRFPRTDESDSVYPAQAARRDRDWIRDAYIEFFAITPSTTAHLAANDTRTFIRRQGSVSAATDYRIELPPDTRESFSPPPPSPGQRVLIERTVTHRLVSSSTSDVTLTADGFPIASVGPTTTPKVSFAGLPPSIQSLELAVTISATVEVTTRKQYRRARRVCRQVGNHTRCSTHYSTYWTTDRDYPSRQLTVRDSVAVEVTNLAPTIEEFAFVDGREVVVINQSAGTPWVSVTLPGGTTIHNGWSFYSVGGRGWDILERSDAGGSARVSSTAIPLELHAFPSVGGPYLPRGQPTPLRIAKTWGPIEQPPTLPPSITVPVVTEPFQQPRAVAVEADDPLPAGDSLRIHGLVRGATARPTTTSRRLQRATTLRLAVERFNRSAGTVDVDVGLTETATGQPIDLRRRPGSIHVNGVSLDTDATGRARATVPFVARIVTARYTPGTWYVTDPAYAPATDRTTIPVRWPDPRRVLTVGVTLVVLLTPLFLAVFLIDRVTGSIGLWPPWRGIR